MTEPSSGSNVDVTLPEPPQSRIGLPGVCEHCNCHASDSVWYYDMALAPNAPPGIYSFLVSQAKSSVWCWDPCRKQPNRADAGLFAAIQEGVSLRMLTAKGLKNGMPPVELILFKTELQRLCNRVTIDVRCFDYAAADLFFHDRYLFVDGDVFIVGTSLTSHFQREYCTAVVRIDDHNGRALLRNRFLDCWNKARPV